MTFKSDFSEKLQRKKSFLEFYFAYIKLVFCHFDELIFFTLNCFFQVLLNSKLGSDQSTHSILSYIIGKSIVMRILF